MKLIKSTLVGVFISSMMFAQAPPPPPGGGNPGGPPQDGPSPAVVDAFFSTGQQPGGFFDFDAAFDAAESTAKAEAQEAGEYDEESWDECVDAGREAMESARADNKSPQEVFQNIVQAVNACGESQGGPGGPPQDGPSPAVVDAFFSTGQQPGGFFDFDAAFDAAESTAKAEAQEAGEYDEESWDECVDAGREAMESARADNKSPQEVFQNIVQAVNACGESQGGDSEDYGDDHMGDDHMGDDHMGDDHGQPPFSPSVMSSVQKYKENNWAVDDSKLDNQEWMDAYNSYDQWKPQEDGNMNQGGPGGPPMGGPGGPPMGGPGGPPMGGPGGPPPIPVYEDMDQDGDGAVTPAEAMGYFQNMPDWNDEAADNFDSDFARVDKNNDGVVDKDEHMNEVAKVMVEEGTEAALQQGKQGAEVFEFVAAGLYDYFVMQTGWRTEDEWTAGRDAAYNVFMEELNNGADEGAAMGAALQAGQAENDPN